MARDVDEACGIAQAAAVMGDWWNLLVLREVARGRRRFDALVDELGVSRKVLTERLGHLVDHEVLARVPYQDRPPRHEYHLTDRGRAFLPVLVGMQDWADRWLLGDGRADRDRARRRRRGRPDAVAARRRRPRRPHAGRHRWRTARSGRRRRPGHRAVHLSRDRPAHPAARRVERHPGNRGLHTGEPPVPRPLAGLRRRGRRRPRRQHPAPGGAGRLRRRRARAVPAALRRRPAPGRRPAPARPSASASSSASSAPSSSSTPTASCGTPSSRSPTSPPPSTRP